MASAVYSGRGLKRTLGAELAVAEDGPAGFGMGGGVFWPRLTGPATRPGAFIGPVPPVTPSFTPLTAAEALSLPFMFWLPAEPEPRLTTFEGAPAPIFDAGMPAIPLLPRLIDEVAGRLEGAMGLVVEPRATAVGCGELLTTEAGMARARFTTFGAGGGWTIFGGAGRTTGIGCTIFMVGGLGTSGSLTSGSLILGGSILAIFGGGGSFGGLTLMAGGSGFLMGIGSVSWGRIFRLSMVFLAAAPMMMAQSMRRMLRVMEVKSEVLLWLPSLRTPKCANCIFCGFGSSLRSGFAIKKSLRACCCDRGGISETDPDGRAGISADGV